MADKNARPRIYFVHIPKTAGTSFRRYLEQHYTHREIYSNRVKTREAYYPAMATLRQSDPAHSDDRLVCGHYFYQLIDWFGTNFSAVTMLRDPVARSVSALRHIQRHAHQYAHLSIDELAQDNLLLQTQVYNLQVRMLGLTFDWQDTNSWPHDIHAAVEVTQTHLDQAKRVLGSMALFGLSERFEETCRLFDHQFSLPMPWGRRQLNRIWSGEKVRHNDGGRMTEQPSATTLEKLAACNVLDQQLYDFAVELFDHHVATIQSHQRK